MKWIKYLLTLSMVLILFAGCQLEKAAENTLDKIADATSQELDQEQSYEQSTEGFKTLKIEVEMTVTDLTVLESDDDTVYFDQKANKEELLADMDTKEDGDTLTIRFKNAPKFKLNNAVQNSKVTLRLPKELATEFYTTIDVGDQSLTGDALTFTRIELHSNVGDTQVILDQSEALELVKTTGDVGDVKVVLKGDYKALTQIDNDTNVGDITVELAGTFDEKLSVREVSNVGDIKTILSGDFSKGLDANMDTDTGDIKVTAPTTLVAAVETDLNKYTSEIHLKGFSYLVDNDNTYFLNGAKEDADYQLDLDVNVGEIYFEAL
ncbi:DUF4097 family beta strand repeat-containing protein [Fusibacter sp. JL298sf-3]